MAVESHVIHKPVRGGTGQQKKKPVGWKWKSVTSNHGAGTTSRMPSRSKRPLGWVSGGKQNNINPLKEKKKK